MCVHIYIYSINWFQKCVFFNVVLSFLCQGTTTNTVLYIYMCVCVYVYVCDNHNDTILVTIMIIIIIIVMLTITKTYKTIEYMAFFFLFWTPKRWWSRTGLHHQVVLQLNGLPRLRRHGLLVFFHREVVWGLSLRVQGEVGLDPRSATKWVKMIKTRIVEIWYPIFSW